MYLTRDLVFRNLVYLTQLAYKYSSRKEAFWLEGERKTPSLEINVSGRAVGNRGSRTVSLPHIVIRILGTATPAHQMRVRRMRRDNIPVRSQQLVLDPEASSATKNIYPSLGRVINQNHNAYNQAGRHTRRKDRFRLILFGQE